MLPPYLFLILHTPEFIWPVSNVIREYDGEHSNNVENVRLKRDDRSLNRGSLFMISRSRQNE